MMKGSCHPWIADLLMSLSSNTKGSYWMRIFRAILAHGCRSSDIAESGFASADSIFFQPHSAPAYQNRHFRCAACAKRHGSRPPPAPGQRKSHRLLRAVNQGQNIIRRDAQRLLETAIDAIGMECTGALQGEIKLAFVPTIQQLAGHAHAEAQESPVRSLRLKLHREAQLACPRSKLARSVSALTARTSAGKSGNTTSRPSRPAARRQDAAAPSTRSLRAVISAAAAVSTSPPAAIAAKPIATAANQRQGQLAVINAK